MRAGLLLFLCFFSASARSAPVVPNFTTGTMTTHTETTSKVTETIVSEDFSTGWDYSVSGTNIQTNSKSLVPPVTGVDSWTGLDVQQRPDWAVVNPGKAFQLVESYQGPGLSKVTTIQRVTEIESITDTVSTFSQ